jgi:hypothetical protein
MNELACISISTVTCLFVVLADVWLVIKYDCCPNMLASSEGPMGPSSFLTAYCLLSPETLLVVCVVVEALIQSWATSSCFFRVILRLLQHLFPQRSAQCYVLNIMLLQDDQLQSAKQDTSIPSISVMLCFSLQHGGCPLVTLLL